MYSDDKLTMYRIMKYDFDTYKYWKKLKERRERDLEELYTAVSGVHSTNYDKVIAGRVSSHGEAPNRIVQASDKLSALHRDIEECNRHMARITTAMEQMDDLEKELTAMRYIQGRTWAAVAQKSGLSMRQVINIVNHAIITTLPTSISL